MLNSQNSAHLRRIGEQNLFSREEAYDLGDGAAKSRGSRAKIDHAGDAIASWMDGDDTGQRPLGWRSELIPYEH